MAYDMYQLALEYKSQTATKDIERQWKFLPPPLDVKIASGVTLLLVGILGMLGNCSVLIISSRILHYRRNLPNILIRNLALVDLCAIPFSYTQALITYFSDGYKGGRTACHVHSFSILFLHFISLLLITTMSIDRYLALSQPFCYEKHLSPTGIWLKIFLVFVVSISLLVALLPIIGIGRNVLQYPGTYCLFDIRTKLVETKIYASFNTITLASVIGVIIYCNLGVCYLGYRLYNGTKRMTTSKESGDRKTKIRTGGQEELLLIRLSLVTTAIFLACWVPFLVRLILGLSGRPFSAGFDFTAARLASMHCVLNAWMYPLLRRQYRESFWYLLRCVLFYLTCGLFSKPPTTLDEIIGGVQSRSGDCLSVETGRRRSYEQREELMRKAEGKTFPDETCQELPEGEWDLQRNEDGEADHIVKKISEERHCT